MFKTRSIVAAAAVAALAACPSNGGPDGGACLGAQATCTASSQCCASFACLNGSCEFVSNGGSTGGVGTSGGAGSGGTSSGSTSAGGTSNGGSGGGSSGGSTGPCLCSGQTPYCDSVGRCLACTSDSQCAAQDLDAGTGTAYCVVGETADSNYGTCVQCNTTAQCQSAANGGGVCDPYAHYCDPSQNCIDGGAGYCSGTPNGEGTDCDPASGECVGCLQDSECVAAGFDSPFCDPVTKSCVQCLKNTDCPYGNPGCFQGYCGQCGYNGDCLPNETCNPNSFPACGCADNTGCGGQSPTCEGADGGANGACGCNADGQCGTGNVCEGDQGGFIGTCEVSCAIDAGICPLLDTNTPACDVGTGQCIVCVANADCSTTGFGNYCIDGGMGNTCITCEANADCDAGPMGTTPFCSAGSCVECLSDNNCASPADAGVVVGPYCEQNSCVACNADSVCIALDAGTPYCAPLSYRCVACDSYTQCPPNAVGCNTEGNTCGGCSQNSDCPPRDGCQFGGLGSLSGSNPYCAGMCGFAGAPTDGGCVQCFSDGDCGDGGSCNLDAGACK